MSRLAYYKVWSNKLRMICLENPYFYLSFNTDLYKRSVLKLYKHDFMFSFVFLNNTNIALSSSICPFLIMYCVRVSLNSIFPWMQLIRQMANMLHQNAQTFCMHSRLEIKKWRYKDSFNSRSFIFNLFVFILFFFVTHHCQFSTGWGREGRRWVLIFQWGKI